MLQKLIKIITITVLWLSIYQANANQVVTKILDSGQGLASITKMPDGSYVVYDTGHWNYTKHVKSEIEKFMGNDKDIALLILSHSDADHIAATDKILTNFKVSKVIRTGFKKDSGTWKRVDKAIRSASKNGYLEDINLAEIKEVYRDKYLFGGAELQILSGYHKPPASWGVSSKSSEYYNANSIVIRIKYAGKSILFAGDAVGRDESKPYVENQFDQAIATERYLIDNSPIRPIISDVLIAGHHGGNDASSGEFIDAVSPSWVIFSAGSGHDHPKAKTAQRFINRGIAPECLLRTDLGDAEDSKKEWNYGRDESSDEKIGDDDVIVSINRSADIIVSYENKEPIICNAANNKSANKAYSALLNCPHSLLECRALIKEATYDGKHSSKSYKEARKAMYSMIDVHDSEVCGVYSGYCQKPKNVSFLDPINAEHTIPQSWFNKRMPMKSDIHHLFPTHKTVNNHRGSLPFGEVSDSETDTWYSNTNKVSLLQENSIPSNTFIEKYSELKKGKVFEPAESHKGDIARAAAYFYTMYPNKAGDIKKLFIGGVNTLVQWHNQDPVDYKERERNSRVEIIQGNRNPYIDIPQLLCKAWAPELCVESDKGSLKLFDVKESQGDKSIVTESKCDVTHSLKKGYDYTQSRDKYPNTNNVDTDYFGLVFNWSPRYCSRLSSNRRKKEFQCRGENDFGWIVHGLWAQASNAMKVSDHPRWCQGDLPAVPFEKIKPYLCMTPSSKLLQGEWEKHGSCDFDTADEFYETTHKLYSEIKMPRHNQGIKSTIRWMKSNNPALTNKRIKTIGSEIMVCYNNQFKIIDCP